jgi:putative pyruvate formate lyase activating enzyme
VVCADTIGPVASYRALLAGGELERRAVALDRLLDSCELCPRRCGADRRKALGSCATGADPVVASWGAHFGEEPPISGTRGSGTIFLANCNLRCVFCQNHDISQRPKAFLGAASTTEELAEIMLELEAAGCHNLNWVSPTHQVPQLVRALLLAARRGLRIPVVYNSNAYDSVAVLALLEGVVDVYLPDLKYADEADARECSRVPDYPRIARAALAEMFRQVGQHWECDGEGVLRQGLLVRLLALPRGVAGVEESLRWLAEALSPQVAVSLMSQYRPAHRAALPGRYPRLARRLTPSEYLAGIEALRRWNTSENTLVQPYLGAS